MFIGFLRKINFSITKLYEIDQEFQSLNNDRPLTKDFRFVEKNRLIIASVCLKPKKEKENKEESEVDKSKLQCNYILIEVFIPKLLKVLWF